MLRMFDFRCTKCDHTGEKLVPQGNYTDECDKCGSPAVRIISPVRCKLDHTFPGESMKWAKKHEAGAKIDTSHKSW